MTDAPAAPSVEWYQREITAMRVAHAAELARMDDYIGEKVRRVRALEAEAAVKEERLQARIHTLETEAASRAAELGEVRAEVSRLQQQRSETMQRLREGVQQELRERQQMAADAKHERDAMRETAERDRQALAAEWKGALELEKERAREREAELKTAVAQLEARLAEVQEQHREERSRLEAQLAEAQRLLQASHGGIERERRERADLAERKDREAALAREVAEHDRRDLVTEWRDKSEKDRKEAAEREAELKAQLRQQEARHAAERREMAETLPRRVEECRAREAAQRGERSTILFPFLRLTLLGRRTVGLSDTLSIGEGLYKLWKDYYKTGVISRKELRQLLRGETQIDRVFLNVEGTGKWNPPAVTLPRDEVEPFYADVVSQLPKLEGFGLRGLPSVKFYYDLVLPPMSLTVSFLQLNYASYTLHDLKQIRARYPRLTRITVDTAKCTNWGEATFAMNMEERKRRVKEILKVDSISWS